MDWLYHPLYADLPPIFWGIFIFIGAAIGSFYNVLALRWGDVHRAESGEAFKQSVCDKPEVSKATLPLLAGRSHCPRCSHQIPIYLNIPLISWVLLRGKSACCCTPISPIYLLFEIWGAMIFTLVTCTVGPTVYGLIVSILLMTLSLTLRLFIREGFIPTGLLVTVHIFSILLLLGPGVQTPEASLKAQMALLAIGAALGRLLRNKLPMALIGAHDTILLGLLGLMAGNTAPIASVGLLAMTVPCMLLTDKFKQAVAHSLGLNPIRLFSFTSATLFTMIACLVILNSIRAFS